MLVFKESPFYQNGLMSIVTLLITICCGCEFVATADTLTNNSLESISDQQTSYQSAPSKPATISLSSAPVQTNTNIQKYAISDLTRDLNLQLKSIEDHELLNSIIQSAFDTLERVPSSIDHNDTKVLNSVATKIDAKISSALRILNETNQKFLNILTENNNNDQSRQLLLDAIILPCTSTTKHAERSTHDSNIESSNDFIGGINKKQAIEVLNFLKNAGHLHENDDRNFTINKRLMETLKSIDLSATNVPNFRDVFFLPRDNQISSTNCRNTVPNEHHR